MLTLDIGDHIRLLEQELMTPSARRDASRLGELLTEDFEEFGSSGRVFTKAEIIAALAEEVPLNLAIVDFRVVPMAEGVVHATYRSVRSLAGMADAMALRSSIWTLRAGKWQMRFHQGTAVPSGRAS